MFRKVGFKLSWATGNWYALLTPNILGFIGKCSFSLNVSTCCTLSVSFIDWRRLLGGRYWFLYHSSALVISLFSFSSMVSSFSSVYSLCNSFISLSLAFFKKSIIVLSSPLYLNCSIFSFTVLLIIYILESSSKFKIWNNSSVV